MKPDWKLAPEWAQYVAEDSDGSWWWHQFKPTMGRLARGWFNAGRHQEARPVTAPNDWRNTLEERP